MTSLKLSKPYSISDHLFHLFLLIIGLSVGIVSTLCLTSFSFTIPSSLSFYIPPSIISQPSSISPAPPPPPSKPVLQIIPVISNGTVNVDVSLMKNNNQTLGLMHNMSDDELLSKASTVQDESNNNVSNYKVAFMFLTPGRLPLAPFWDRFFKGYEGNYSIYVHPHPSYNESVPQDSAFYARRIPSQPVYWGTISMIDAERRLLANALLDPSNQKFVLLSDSCIPVFNFTTVYNHLMGTNLSSLQIFDDPRKPGRGRYNRRMWPEVTIEQWRKGSQWFEIHRDLAVKIVSDKKYYKLFSEFCLPPCYNDEHYLPTLVNILFPERNSNRTLTWVDWSRGGPHPRKFGWIDVKVEILNHIRFEYECEYNGNTTNMCHLFARKFLPNTLGPLLKVAPRLLGFDP
ncbi:hypothetical protein BUALT_Bualt04G0083000 [Buddleja alternifolia]|uniref:Uncharacterized protein n=1 Tax=Buddleja alternifolia TaxID=168488 RepID=A0AAV6XM89_9LAMI|nr:hypothetical protein BUALT_Bualt04G0083000 [Buddleja alternifolia]